MAKSKVLGIVTAYAYAVQAGYTGTEADFAEQLNLAMQAGGYADSAQQSAQSARQYYQDTRALFNSIDIENGVLIIGSAS